MLLFPVSTGDGRSSRLNKKMACVTLSAFQWQQNKFAIAGMIK
jgi:hypothetical protein